MLKISQISGGGVPTVLRLEGKVVGPWVDELRRVCAEMAPSADGRSPGLVLDLSGVSFLDADAIALFQQLVTDHVSIANYSVFVGAQLKEVSDVER
jgi:anti-anti-sigma regulatory factor